MTYAANAAKPSFFVDSRGAENVSDHMASLPARPLCEISHQASPQTTGERAHHAHGP